MVHKRFIHLALFIAALLFLMASPMRTAQAAPNAACTFTSAGTGNWTTVAWTRVGTACSTYPGQTFAGDTVIIRNGDTVTLNVSPAQAIASLQVGQGATGILIVGDNSTLRTLTVSGSILIDIRGTIQPGVIGNSTVHQLNVGGNFTNNGTFLLDPGNPRIQTTFNGTTPQTIGGSNVAAFYNLIVNSGATVIFPATAIPTVANIMTNNGTVQQTRTVNSGTVEFLRISGDKYRGVDITPSASLGSVTVKIRHVTSRTCTSTGGTSPAYILRCYNINPTTSASATVRLWALNSENPAPSISVPVPYRYVAPNWVALFSTTSGIGSGGYIYGQGTTTGFSAFLLGSPANAPTAVNLNQISAMTTSSGLVATLLVITLFLLSIWLWHKRQLRLVASD